MKELHHDWRVEVHIHKMIEELLVDWKLWKDGFRYFQGLNLIGYQNTHMVSLDDKIDTTLVHH